MKVSCAAYSYRDYLKSGKMDLMGFLEEASRMSLDGVELTAYYFPSTDDNYLCMLKRKAYLLGLDISGTAVGNNFCQADPEERAKQVKMVKDWIDISVKLGAPCIRVFAGAAPKGYSEEEATRWVIESLRECAAYAEPRGILIALENHGGVTSKAEQIINILKEVGSDWVGANLDTGNYRDDPYGEIAATAPYAFTCHAKVEVPDGDGKVKADFSRIVSDLKNAGYKGYLTIEYESEEDPITAVPKFARELQHLVRIPK